MATKVLSDDIPGPSRRPSAISRLDPLPSTHPLSLKIRSIFDTSSPFLSDAQATKDALQELEERYGVRKAEKRRGKKATSTHPSNAGRIISVDTERARRCVADDAQDSLESACLSYLDALNVVDQAVSEMGSHLAEMRVAYNDVDARLRLADEATHHLLQNANGLRKQRTLAAQQATLLDLFLARFTLSAQEQDVIESRSIPVGTSLFATMDKLDRIRKESQVLLVGQEEGAKGGMRAGIEIMEETSILLDRAQQKIAKWLHAEMRSFAREGVDVGQFVREAVVRLDGRDDLLGPALKTLSSARAQLLSTAFQRALTIGGPAPTFLPRPIELHAHDPMRYVGDMLAWVHQSLASEREFLTALFSKIGDLKSLEGMRRMGQRRRGLEGSIDWTGDDTAGLPKAELWTRETLDKVLEGCCQPLQVRIEQTVSSQEGCITTFRLASLIQFYRVTMERTLGTRAALSRTLKSLSVSAYRSFVATLDKQGSGLERFHEAPEQNDLDPPAPVLGSAATLKELLAVHQASVSETDLFGDALPLRDLPTEEMRDFGIVIQKLVEPILSLSIRMGDALVSKRGRGRPEEEARWKRDILLINCFDYVKKILEPYHYTARLIARVDEQTTRTVEELIQRHYLQLCAESGLELAKQSNANIPHGMSEFESFLGSPTLISSPHLDLLNTPTTRAHVHSRALELVAQEYEKVVATIRDAPETNVGDAPLRDAAQIRLLLGIESRTAV